MIDIAVLFIIKITLAFNIIMFGIVTSLYSDTCRFCGKYAILEAILLSIGCDFCGGNILCDYEKGSAEDKCVVRIKSQEVKTDV